MILADTSVSIDHLGQGDAMLSDMPKRGRALSHAFAVGELATGSLRQREVILHALRGLPRAAVAQDAEVRDFIEPERCSAAAHVTPMPICWPRSG